MSDIKTHRDLEAWQIAMDLAMAIYEATDGFPDRERYGLTSQIRRAAVSVPSNIAEGQAYGLMRSCLHYLRIALGSLGEVDTQLEIARRRKYITDEHHEKMMTTLVSTRRLVSGLRRAKAQRLGTGSLAVIIVAIHRLW
jgi:four helix bundle protein